MRIIAIQTCPDQCCSLYQEEFEYYGIDCQEVLDTGVLDLSGKGLTELPMFVRCLGSAIKCLKLNDNPDLGSIPEWIYFLVNLQCLELRNCGLLTLPDTIFDLRKLEYFCADGTHINLHFCCKKETFYKETLNDKLSSFYEACAYDDDYFVYKDNYIIDKKFVKENITNAVIELNALSYDEETYYSYFEKGRDFMNANRDRFSYVSGFNVSDKYLRCEMYGTNVEGVVGMLVEKGYYSEEKMKVKEIPNWDYKKWGDKKIEECKKTYVFGSDGSGLKFDGFGTSASAYYPNYQNSTRCFTCELLKTIMINLGLGEIDINELLNKLSSKEIQLLNLKYMALVELQNEITFNGIQYLTGLQFLDLAKNQLYSIPTQLKYLKNLIVLGLYGNHITSLPDFLDEMDSLKVLNLAKNDQDIPITINDYIENYLNNITEYTTT